MLTLLPRKDKAFVGRALPFYYGPLSREPRFPFPNKLLGMMYIMSYDLVEVIGRRSYKVLPLMNATAKSCSVLLVSHFKTEPAQGVR
jgi:hypothetical protein